MFINQNQGNKYKTQPILEFFKILKVEEWIWTIIKDFADPHINLYVTSNQIKFIPNVILITKTILINKLQNMKKFLTLRFQTSLIKY